MKIRLNSGLSYMYVLQVSAVESSSLITRPCDEDTHQTRYEGNDPVHPQVAHASTLWRIHKVISVPISLLDENRSFVAMLVAPNSSRGRYRGRVDSATNPETTFGSFLSEEISNECFINGIASWGTGLA